MLTRLTISSIPGMRASSSAITESMPRLRNALLTESCSLLQPRRISSRALTSCAQRFGANSFGSEVRGLFKQSARLWARSVLTTRVRLPIIAERTAVAAEMVVLPTPPFPRYSMIRIVFLTDLFYFCCTDPGGTRLTGVGATARVDRGQVDRKGQPYYTRVCLIPK